MDLIGAGREWLTWRTCRLKGNVLLGGGAALYFLFDNSFRGLSRRARRLKGDSIVCILILDNLGWLAGGTGGLKDNVLVDDFNGVLLNGFGRLLFRAECQGKNEDQGTNLCRESASKER